MCNSLVKGCTKSNGIKKNDYEKVIERVVVSLEKRREMG